MDTERLAMGPNTSHMAASEAQRDIVDHGEHGTLHDQKPTDDINAGLSGLYAASEMESLSADQASQGAGKLPGGTLRAANAGMMRTSRWGTRTETGRRSGEIVSTYSVKLASR